MCFATELGWPAVTAAGSPESVPRWSEPARTTKTTPSCRAPPTVSQGQEELGDAALVLYDEPGSPAAAELAPAEPVTAERGPVERI